MYTHPLNIQDVRSLSDPGLDDFSLKISHKEGRIYLLTCLNKFIHKNERDDHIRCYVYGDYLPLDIWIEKYEHVVDEKGPFTQNFLQILH